ncbi:MAG: hypothetical protein Q8K75_04155 [Chlamydiales bacterium]|nr:hypothetical protein [Chlamydiales bacterium]
MNSISPTSSYFPTQQTDIGSAPNAAQLSKLRDRLSQINYDTSEVYEEWSQLASDPEGSSFALSDRLIDDIVELAKTQANPEKAKILESLIQNLRMGKCTFSESTIDQLVQEHSLSCEMASLLKWIMKREFVIAQTEGRQKYLESTKDERLVVKALGFSVRQLNQRTRLSNELEWVLFENGQQLASNAATIQELRNSIDTIARQERLKLAGIPEKGISNVMRLIDQISQTRDLILHEIETKLPDETLIDGFAYLPKASTSIKEEMNQRRQLKVLDIISDVLNQCLEGSTLHKQCMTGDCSDLLERLGEHLVQKAADLDPSSITSIELDRTIAWYRKWAPNITNECIQGLHTPDELLHIGLCRAISARISMREQDNADCRNEDILGPFQATPTDRYVQALYECELKAKAESFRGKKATIETISALQGLTILGQRGYQAERALFNVTPFPSESLRTAFTYGASSSQAFIEILQQLILQFKQEIVNRAETLMLSDGVIGICLGGESWGHRIHMRIDTQRQIYRLFNPDVGMLRFNDSTGQLQVMECFADLLEAFHPDTLAITGWQLIKK